MTMDNVDKQLFDPRQAEGDARTASIAIERWLRARFQTGDDRDTVFDALRDSIEALMQAPRLRNDPIARSIMNEMGRAQSMDDVVAALDRLDARMRLPDEQATGTAQRRTRAVRTLLRL